MVNDAFSARDVNALAKHYTGKLEAQRRALVECAQARRHLRMVAFALLAALPLAFVFGRGTGDRGVTIRQAEAAPVPSELPEHVERFHDAAQAATCWLVRSGGGPNYPVSLSCLPDQWLAPAQIAAEGDAP